MSIRRLVPIEQVEWHVRPAPDWVEARDPDWSYEPAAGEAVAFLLLDEQHHVATQACAQRSVRRLMTLAAVQSLGQVELEFDPAAHRLLVHELAVWRGGADGAWAKRSLARREAFLLRQREQQLEQQMLNGRVSLVALLEDVRVGDAIDLAWTVDPIDRLPGLRFTAIYAFVWTVPVARAFLTLHLDATQPVRWRMHLPDGVAGPHEEVSPGRAAWRVERPLRHAPEANVPSGHWSFAVLDVSAWSSWSEVAGMFAALWADALAEGAEAVAGQAACLREGHVLADAVRGAIRFVQEDVRYLAVDFGHGAGMLPNGAGTVLRRRFGDCKDKSVLLTALLRALGVEAWPLLVGTGWRQALERLQPSVEGFNHAIVFFVVDGRRYFVDPTLVGQGGDLARLVSPPYRFGLEVRDGAQALLALPDPPPAELTLTETFHLDRRQREGGVEQALEASAWLADDIRAALVRQGPAALFEARAQALRQHFPALAAGSEPTVADDGAANRIEVRDRYGLPSWGAPGEQPPQVFSYGAYGLFLAVETVDEREARQQPWALRFPMRVRHRVIVRGKCVRRAKPERHRFSGPGFRYSCDVASRRREVTFDYLWETTQRAVPPEDWPAYCRERGKALSHAGAHVVTGGRRAGPMLRLGLAALVVLVVGVAQHLGRQEPRRQPLDEAARQEVERTARAVFDAFRRGEVARAGELIERVKPYYTHNFEFQAVRTEVAIRRGRFEEAREALALARRLRAEDPLPDRLEAALHESLGDVARAREVLERVVARWPGESHAYLDLARVTERAGDRRAARAAWEAALARSPAHPEALFSLARLLWADGERERADALITGAIRAQPTASAVLETTLARYYSATGRHAEALVPARRAAELAPEDPGVARRYAMALVNAGQRAAAVEAARRMTERFPEDPLAWGALATAAATAAEGATAERAFQAWLRLAPTDPDAHSNFGYFLYREGRAKQAREVLQRATVQFPGNGLVWRNYAVALDALGEGAAASEARRRADALLTDEQRATLAR